MVSLRRFGGTFPLFVAAVIWLLGSAVEAEPPRDPAAIRAHVSNAVRAVERNRSLGVDASIIESAVVGGIGFSQNFCGPGPDHQELCERGFDDPAVLEQVISAHLDALLSRPRHIDTVGSLIAAGVGADFARAGWPTNVPNEIAVIVIPDQWRTARFEINDSGLIFHAGTKHLLVRPGQTRVTAHLADGSTVSTSIAIHPRAEVSFKGAASGNLPPILIIDPPTERFCPSINNPVFAGPTAAFNWGRATLAEDDSARLANLAPFVQQTALQVSIEDRTGVTCDNTCRANLASSFTRAIATWRSGCGRCDNNTLVALGFGDIVWIDTRLANRLRLLAVAPETPLDLSETVNDGASSLPVPSPAGTSTPVASFRQINHEIYFTNTICGLQRTRAPWVPGTQALLCGGPHSTDMKVYPTIVLLADATHCGSSDDFLACGIPGAGIELTLKNTRWAGIGASGPYEFGPATARAFDVETVVLHEVGHWFGVPHAEIASQPVKDVMTQTYSVDRPCISGQSLLFMNNAADLRWSYRVTEGGGLRRPPSPRAGATP